ncbi:MAG: hypothetical protein GF375_04815 [Candidatus Omnitrophica bacterium]|nr:hypothetical protein [Candidatus Omnitrophota bacterium]MBD3269349.1 hypothetical protein [Candidatus Omnitrophota bacterium]
MKNHLKRLPQDFKKMLYLASGDARRQGMNIYMVGGVVRDLLIGKRVLDLDIVVEGDAIILVRKLASDLGLPFRRHHSFGTATIYFRGHKIDFATARTEHYLNWGDLPKVEPSTLSRDLFRRDFTINAMAISLNEKNYGELIDLYNGLSDLRKGLVRVLHEKSFLEDPTRIFRAIRFERRFSFKIEETTMSLLRQAISNNILRTVNPHRIRNEICLILKEDKPLKYIRRINRLVGFGFMDRGMKIGNFHYRLFKRIDNALQLYYNDFFLHREVCNYVVYLTALLIRLSPKKLFALAEIFGFRKGERVIIFSVKKNINRIKRLNRKDIRPSSIYKILAPLSFESIIFFYAYYPHSYLRNNISYFFHNLAGVSLKIKGRDLKKMGLEPESVYGRVLEKLLWLKLDKGLETRVQELSEAEKIFRELTRQKVR